MKKRVFRGVGLCAMLLCLSLSLCGCMFEQSEGMYALPILPDPSETAPSLLVEPKASALNAHFRQVVL